MTGGRDLKTAAIFGLAGAGLSIYVNIFLQSRTYTIISHGFRLFGSYLAMFLALWIAFTAFLILSARMAAGIETRAFGSDPEDRFKRNTLAAAPFLFFLLTPLLFSNYMTRDDFRARLVLFGVFVAAAVVFLKLPDIVPQFKKQPPLLDKWNCRFKALSLRKKLVFLFLAAFAVYNLAAFALVSQGITFSGDEPYYLLSADSLLYDKDINLANNYADQDYFHFYSKEDAPKKGLGVYGRYGKKGQDFIYPINLPGISVLMLPWYKVSQLFKGPWLTFILKGSLSIWAALLGLQIFLLARELWHREKLALAVWLLYSFSAPVFFYAVHLYPEIPIALFSIFIYRKVTSARSPSNALLIFLGFLLGSFPWFGLKYNFIFWPLLIVSAYFLWTRHKLRARILLFLLFPVLGTVLFYYFVFSLYGTISPFAVYEGITSPEQNQAFKETVLGIPLRARLDTLFDYFLDQRDGLLLYSPLYFFMFLGLIEVFRKSKRDVLILLFLSLPFILNYAFFTHRQGHCPQARVLAPLSWIGALLIGYFLASNRLRIFRTLFWAAGLATLTITVLLLFHPSFLYQPTTHEFTQRPGELFVFLSNMRLFLPSFFPSFIKTDNLGYVPNYVWIALAVLFVIFYAWRSGRKRRDMESRRTLSSGRRRFAGAGLRLGAAALLLGIAFGFWVYQPRCVLYPTQTFTYSTQKQLGLYLFPLGKDVVAKNEGELYLHDDREYKVIFGSREKLEQLKIVFGSMAGEHDVRLRLFDLPLFEGRTAREKRDVILKAPASFPFRNLHLYEIDFRFEQRSSENLKIDPYFLQILPLR